MREAIVAVFKDKFNCDIYQNMTPEKVPYPVGAFAIADEIVNKEIDGYGFTSREVIFDVSIVCKDLNQVDLIRYMLLELSGKTGHRWSNLFSVMFVRSVEDVGPYLGVDNDENPPHIIDFRLSFFE